MVSHVLTDEPAAALTFDDGPDPIYTPEVLRLLRRYDARATFFVVGDGALQYPEIIRQAAAGGHAIGNHSWSHRRFPTLGLIKCWQELRRCREATRPYGQMLFRPPFGANSRRTNLLATLCGYIVVGWSVDVADWCEGNASVMLEGLVARIRPGCIVLLHDRLYTQSVAEKETKRAGGRIIERDQMLLALKGTLERLRDTIDFVTLPALFNLGVPRCS